MADRIEIDNVGGRDGVASEATMQLLLMEFRAKAGTDSRYQKLAERATNLNTQAQNKNTKETNLATKAIKGLAGSAKGFAKEAVLGGDRLGDFAAAVFGSSSVLTKFVRFGDNTIDTLRGLTSVGASFNNNMFDMIGASANSAMNLDDFASMVQNNSGIIATFGTTVTAGARSLGQFSKEFRTGIGQEFFSMGFTIGDVNEGLISFLDLERRRSLAGLRTDRASQQAAADYIVQLDRLTKITGEEREQIADRLRQQMQDAGVRAQVNRLEGTARTNFQNSLAFIESQLSGPLADGLKDLMDGVAQTDLGKALQSQVPGIGEFAQQMFRGGKSVDEVIDAMTNRFGPQLQSLSGQFNKAQLDQMRMSGGVTGAIAEILDSSYQINQLTGRDAEAAAEEQTRRDRITATLGGFENAITNIRKFFVDAFLDASNRTDGLSAAFKTLFATVGNLFGNGTGSLAELGPTVTKYFNSWFGTGGSVTNLVNRFSNALATTDWEALFASLDSKFTSLMSWLSDITTTYRAEGFGAALKKAGNDVLQSVLDLFLGAKVDVDPRDIETDMRRQGGLLKGIYDGILGMLDSTGATAFMTQVYDTVYNFLFEKDANGKTKMQTFLSTAYQNMYDFLFEKDANGKTKLGKFLSDTYQKMYDFLFVEENGGKTKLGQFLSDTYQKMYDFLFVEEDGGKTRLQQLLGDTYQAIYDFLFVTENGGKTRLQQFLSDTYNEVYSFMFEKDDNGKNKWINFLETAYNDLYAFLFPETSGPSFLDKAKAKLNEMIFGEVVGDPRDGVRKGGIINLIADGFAALMENVTVIKAMKDAIADMTNTAMNTVDASLRSMLGMTEGQTFMQKIDEMVTRLTNSILDIINRRIPELMSTAIASAKTAMIGTETSSSIASGGTAGAGNESIGGAVLDKLTGFGELDRDQFLREGSGNVLSSLSLAFGNLLGMGIDDWFDDKINAVVQGEGVDRETAKAAVAAGLSDYISNNYSGEDLATMNSYMADKLMPILQSRRIGTLRATGQMTEPEDTTVNLHKGERVLNPSEAAAYNQTGGDAKLDQLNNTMMQVVALLAQGNQISDRTAKGLRGMTNDFYRGMA